MTVATTQPAHQAEWRNSPLDADGQRNLTTREALVESGLDWTVKKVPSTYEWNGQTRTMSGRWAVVRESDGHGFGTVGKTWQPTQNHEGFALVDDLMRIAGNEMPVWIEHALPLNGGKKVILMVRLDTGLQIAGEKYMSYLSFVNGHDGRTSVTAATHDERYVCSNGQIGWAMGRGESHVIRVRHTKNAGARIKEAIQILRMRNRQAELLAKQGEWLVEQTLSDDQFDKFLTSLMPITDETTGPHMTMITERRDAVRSIYAGADNLSPIRGTRWGALQAVLEYSDHGREFKTPDTAISSQLGLTDQPIKLAAVKVLSDKRLRPVEKITA